MHNIERFRVSINGAYKWSQVDRCPVIESQPDRFRTENHLKWPWRNIRIGIIHLYCVDPFSRTCMGVGFKRCLMAVLVRRPKPFRGIYVIPDRKRHDDTRWHNYVLSWQMLVVCEALSTVRIKATLFSSRIHSVFTVMGDFFLFPFANPSCSRFVPLHRSGLKHDINAFE